jgi:signal transduction histidine kinase
VTARVRWSIPLKAAATAGGVLLVIGALQLVVVARWPTATRTWWRLALLFVLPYPGYVIASAAFARHIVVGRTRRLIRVLDAIARGDLHSELAPLLDTDLQVVRDALGAMRVALDELTTRLRHTDAQRRRLFADLAHELATPTTTILAIAEALADPALCRSDADRARITAALDHEAARLGRLIRDVRDLARLDDPDIALELADVDLAAVARRAAGRLDLAAPDRPPIAITTTAVPPVHGDEGRLDQVVMNLLSNARRYTPAHSAIHLAVTPHGAGVRLTVEDDGAGVPDDALPRLGERLFRVDPSRTAKTGGTGLGLSIVAAVVHRHGGTLRFERAAVGGLRVVIELPTGRPP